MNEETICLSWLTIKRTTKVRKKTVTEFQKITKETFLHKGISPEVIIRRRGVLNRLRKLTGWTTGKLEIVKVEIVTTHSQGCPETLENIEAINI
jgi:hypothetical protein